MFCQRFHWELWYFKMCCLRECLVFEAALQYWHLSSGSKTCFDSICLWISLFLTLDCPQMLQIVNESFFKQLSMMNVSNWSCVSLTHWPRTGNCIRFRKSKGCQRSDFQIKVQWWYLYMLLVIQYLCLWFLVFQELPIQDCFYSYSIRKMNHFNMSSCTVLTRADLITQCAIIFAFFIHLHVSIKYP